MDAPLVKSITRNRMEGMEQPAQILFPTTEIGGSIKYFTGISNSFNNDTANQMDHSIKPTIDHFKPATLLWHSDMNHFPLGSLYSGTDVPKSGKIQINAHGKTHRDPSLPRSQSLTDQATATSSTH